MHFVFISDFDGTITKKDFYWLMIEKYIGQKGKDLYEDWQMRMVSDISFLNMIFNNIDQEEAQILMDIDSIPIDETSLELIDWVLSTGNEFKIISAGCSYYIVQILKKYGLEGKVELLANPGYYKDKNIFMTPDTKSPYYHPTYGIDKGKVIRYFRSRGILTFFAGDSRPDYDAAVSAHYGFALKDSQLALMMKKERQTYFEYQDFSEIRLTLQDLLQ